MPIKIHHGPNGSFKTSGAVWDDAVPAMKAGRPLVTNIRGVSTERCLELFPDLPDSFQVIHIDTETVDGRDKAASWFQWVPKNAFIIFDEPQVFFRKSWTDRDLKQFDYPGGPDQAKADDRPSDWMDAWTRHRHWNWDVVLCTPNIRYLRDDIRQTSEMAYLHTNLGVLGKGIKFLLRADYKEVMHNAQDNRPTGDKNISHFKKIDKRVFKLYDSTATGQHRDTFTGQSLLLSPKVLFPLGFLAVLLAVMYHRTGFSVATDGIGGHKASDPVPTAAAPAEARPATARPVAPDHVPDTARAQPVSQAVGPFAGLTITIKAGMATATKGVIYRFEIDNNGRTFSQDSRDMLIAGYSIRSRGLCAADLIFDGQSQTVVCSGSAQAGRADERNAERGGEARLGLATSTSNEPRLTVVGTGKPGHLW